MNILLGPLFFIRDQAPDNFWTGVILVAVLIPAMGIGFIRPWKMWRIAIAILAAICWLFAGLIGRAISA